MELSLDCTAQGATYNKTIIEAGGAFHLAHETILTRSRRLKVARGAK